jgi:hypothetical protein
MNAFHSALAASLVAIGANVPLAAQVIMDPCGGSPRCYNAGNFIAEVMQVTPTAMTPGARHHSVTFNIRFRNVGTEPVILAYRSGSSAATDNFGNRFFYGRAGTHDTSVKGMGLVTGRSADTQFVLNPGQTRSATFGLVRFEARPPIGEAWNYDVVIDEIGVLPGQQVKSLRQNALNFVNLTPGSGPGVAAASTPATLPGVPNDPGVQQATDVANKVFDLLNAIKKK